MAIIVGASAIFAVFAVAAGFILREHLKASAGIREAKNHASPDSLLLEQWKALRSEQDKLFEDSLQTERNVLVAAGAIYTFLFTQFSGDKPSFNLLLPSAWLVWWLPFALVVLGALRCLAFYGRIELIGEYLRSVEKSAGIARGTGWNNWLHDSKKFGTAALSLLTLVSWLAISEGTWYLSFTGAQEHRARSAAASSRETGSPGSLKH